MIREDEFVTLGKPDTIEQLWSLRSTYRRLSKKIKRKFDRQNVKAKQALDFPTWYAFVDEGIRQGRLKFELHRTKPIDLDMGINRTIETLTGDSKKNMDYLKTNDYYKSFQTKSRVQRFEELHGEIQPVAPVAEPVETEELVKNFVEALPEAVAEKPKRTRKKKVVTE